MRARWLWLALTMMAREWVRMRMAFERDVIVSWTWLWLRLPVGLAYEMVFLMHVQRKSSAFEQFGPDCWLTSSFYCSNRISCKYTGIFRRQSLRTAPQINQTCILYTVLLVQYQSKWSLCCPYYNIKDETPNFSEDPIPWRCAAQFNRRNTKMCLVRRVLRSSLLT